MRCSAKPAPISRSPPQARYERFDQTLATIKRAGVTRLGFVGNAQFAAFDRP